MAICQLSEEKVIEEAALRSGLSKHVIRAAWEVCGEVVAAWCMEGHSCPLPGLGHMRFGIRADSAGNIEDVSDKLIRMRRIHFVPSVAIKEEMAKTGVSITCYDKKGKKIKTVESKASGSYESGDDAK